MNILEVKNLRVEFKTEHGVLRAVDNVSFSLKKGKSLGIVGESGCGKTVTALSLLRLIEEPGRIKSGKILFHSEITSEIQEEPIDLLQIPEKRLCEFRGKKIAMIFQEPMTSLNPVFTIGNQLCEPLILHEKLSPKQAQERAVDLLKKVRMPDPELRLNDYPHQLSGGMRQRVMIAMALACKPDILIADEPTTALDVTIQAQILDLIQDLSAEYQMSVILITHDLGIVSQVCDEVAVMYAGKIVEQAPVRRLFTSPKHPYTVGLLSSIPVFEAGSASVRAKLQTIPGTVPDLLHLPQGCRFLERCPRVALACGKKIPRMRYVGEGQSVRCINT